EPTRIAQGAPRQRILVSGRERCGDHRSGDAATDTRSDHSAGVAGGMDQPAPRRAHPGGRARRGRPETVPLPRTVAGGTQRGEVRPDAGDVGTTARDAAAAPRRSPWPRTVP